LPAAATGLLVVLLVAEAAGVHARNDVWHDDVSLWRDTTAKSPENARAWMNFGVALMASGDYPGAVDACERALVLAPEYVLVHVNLGVAYGEVGRAADAEREFLAAQRLAPDDWRTHVYYAEWLRRQGRAAEAAGEERRARELNPIAMSNQ
jgi:tetratricopeptide (TPR) repeat protein